MIIGAAILIGFLIATAEAKRTGQNPEDYLDMGIVGVIAGIAGARIYYVIFSWDYIKIIFCLSLISEKVVWQFMAA